MACLAFWGCEGGRTEWEGIPVYGRQLDGYGNDAIAQVARDFRADVIFTLIDLWVMDPNIGHHGAQWWPLFPIDHDPIPAQISARFPHAHGLICYSRHAAKMVEAVGFQPTYVPHCVDCSVYRPCTPEEKLDFRKRYFGDWPDNAFIAMMCAANKGYPSRKSFPEAMEAFAAFANDVPEARLYMHSYPLEHYGGPNLQLMAQYFGIAEKTRFLNPPLFMAGHYKPEMMRELYCSADVLLSPSQGEGWGIPIVEAGACGVPQITTNFSSMPELTTGWTVPPLRLIPTPLQARQAEADIRGVVHALQECYRQPEGARTHWQQMAREHAAQYDIPTVMEQYWLPLLARLDAGRKEMSLELREAPC